VNTSDAIEGDATMADSGGGAGILGVVVGVMLVIFVGFAVLMATGGRLGNSGPSLTIKMPSAK
jgi:ABC-type transporter Mla subunit MlaD